MRTISLLFVFDPNGFPVAKCPFVGDIARWMTFSTRDGFDFVAFQDTDLNAFYFEAANPAEMIPLDSGGARLACIDYDWQTDRFFFIAETGKILVVSRTLSGQ
jgi:hypothetical protein